MTPSAAHVATLVLVLGAIAAPRVARADGPGCTAAPCGDADGDGFVACGCAPAGSACDCDDADPRTFPSAPEACGAAKDFDCNGTRGVYCGRESGCLAGVCVPQCVPLDDFGCPTGSDFGRQPDGTCLCVPQDCTVFGCPPGSTCDDDKKCVASCHPGVTCPYGQRCRGSGCVDPCDGVVCARGAACAGGVCVVACDCPGARCAAGEACDTSRAPAECVEEACVGVVCPGGTHCARGACVDDCAGVVCPPNRVCQPRATDGGVTRGECVDLCSPDPCPGPERCDWRTGACLPPLIADGGLVAPEESADEALRVVGGGWACSTGGLARASGVAAAGALGATALLALRRRRRGRDRER